MIGTLAVDILLIHKFLTICFSVCEACVRGCGRVDYWDRVLDIYVCNNSREHHEGGSVGTIYIGSVSCHESCVDQVL